MSVSANAAAAFKRVYSGISSDMWASLPSAQQRSIIMEAIDAAKQHMPLSKFSQIGESDICDYIMSEPATTGTDVNSLIKVVLSGKGNKPYLARQNACEEFTGGIERLDALKDLMQSIT